MKKRKTVRKYVEIILSKFPETRNCDKLLTLKYWQHVDGLPMKDENSVSAFKNAFLESSTSMESIRRARQLIQEEGKLLPTKSSVIQSRNKKKNLMEEAIISEREVV